MSFLKRLFGAASLPTISIDPVTKAAASRVERGGHCTCLQSKAKSGSPNVPSFHIDTQDVTLPGWRQVCQLVAAQTEAQSIIFEPSANLSRSDWADIITLPSSIGSLSTIKQLRLYGSHLKRLPPELGSMKSLENLDIYTSYSLHWLPYEVTRCLSLQDSRMSTRALYGNTKTRLPFPRLRGPVQVLMPVGCSVCNEPFKTNLPQLLWTTQRIATDNVPLLIHSCSAECTALIPDAPHGYHARPHKGGGGVGMPDPKLSDYRSMGTRVLDS